MDFLKLAKERHTTYAFSDKPVSDKDIEKILDAGRWAPSCLNIQPWNFIVIKDKAMMESLTQSSNYGETHTAPAAMVAVVLQAGMTTKEGLSCIASLDQDGPYDSYMCCGMAALQMILEAESRKIDSCLLTPNREKAKKLLKVRPEDALAIIVGFGYQSKGAKQKKRWRKELNEIVSHEFFGENPARAKASANINVKPETMNAPGGRPVSKMPQPFRSPDKPNNDLGKEIKKGIQK